MNCARTVVLKLGVWTCHLEALVAKALDCRLGSGSLGRRAWCDLTQLCKHIPDPQMTHTLTSVHHDGNGRISYPPHTQRKAGNGKYFSKEKEGQVVAKLASLNRAKWNRASDTTVFPTEPCGWDKQTFFLFFPPTIDHERVRERSTVSIQGNCDNGMYSIP